MLHLVNKLTFEAICSDESTAFDIRHHFSQYCQQKIPAAFDEICTKYSGQDEWIQIDRLEIDLGTIDPGNFDYSLSNSLYPNLEKEISDKLRSLSADRRTQSKKLSLFELITYFLQKGVLPWWAEGSAFNIDEICTEVLKEQKTAFHQFLLQNRSNEKIWKRLSMQFTSALREQVVYLFDELVTAEQKILLYKRQLVTDTERRSDAGPEPDIIRQLILLKAPLLLAIDVSTASEVLEKLVQDAFNKSYAGKEPPTPTSEAEKINVLAKKAEWIEKDRPDDGEAVNKIMVKHAGIVLFAPFFEALFTKLDLLKDNNWKTDRSRDTAIHILRYISTGEQSVPEYDLGLEKLLCGAFDEPIERDIMLMENDKQEVQELLRSVIEHWKGLKNTSVAGLRETFLKRDGILVKKEDGWVLTVERKTVDVLMESIPWGYSTIILPWNSYLIYVEW